MVQSLLLQLLFEWQGLGMAVVVGAFGEISFEIYCPSLQRSEDYRHGASEPYYWQEASTSFGKILAALQRAGFKTGYRVMDASNYGVPQRRARLFLIGTKGDVKPWGWPQQCKFRSRDFEADILDPMVSSDCIRRLPSKDHKYENKEPNRERRQVKRTIKKLKIKAKNVFPSNVEKAKVLYNVLLRRCVVDVGSSLRYGSTAVGCFGTLTKTRLQHGKYWMCGRGRYISISEMFKAFGILESEVDWQGAGLSKQSMGAMLGNSMSLPLTELLLEEALRVIGYLA